MRTKIKGEYAGKNIAHVVATENEHLAAILYGAMTGSSKRNITANLKC